MECLACQCCHAKAIAATSLQASCFRQRFLPATQQCSHRRRSSGCRSPEHLDGSVREHVDACAGAKGAAALHMQGQGRHRTLLTPEALLLLAIEVDLQAWEARYLRGESSVYRHREGDSSARSHDMNTANLLRTSPVINLPWPCCRQPCPWCSPQRPQLPLHCLHRPWRASPRWAPASCSVHTCRGATK